MKHLKGNPMRLKVSVLKEDIGANRSGRRIVEQAVLRALNGSFPREFSPDRVGVAAGHIVIGYDVMPLPQDVWDFVRDFDSDPRSRLEPFEFELEVWR
jgi:hypothetical protein